jgi:hypothetical protein
MIRSLAPARRRMRRKRMTGRRRKKKRERDISHRKCKPAKIPQQQ